MKKFLIILITVTTIFILNDLTNEEVVIPSDAIRFRVIANSNDSSDIKIKEKVAQDLEQNIFKTIEAKETKKDVEDALVNNLDLYKTSIDNTLKENNCDTTYTINYGENYFPSKNYKNVVYKSGNYSSLVVTLGRGEGKNFWCVLFPPLCLIDEETNKDVEYHFLVKDLINKYFKS